MGTPPLPVVPVLVLAFTLEVQPTTRNSPLKLRMALCPLLALFCTVLL